MKSEFNNIATNLVGIGINQEIDEVRELSREVSAALSEIARDSYKLAKDNDFIEKEEYILIDTSISDLVGSVFLRSPVEYARLVTESLFPLSSDSGSISKSIDEEYKKVSSSLETINRNRLNINSNCSETLEEQLSSTVDVYMNAMISLLNNIHANLLKKYNLNVNKSISAEIEEALASKGISDLKDKIAKIEEALGKLVIDGDVSDAQETASYIVKAIKLIINPTGELASYAEEVMMPLIIKLVMNYK